MWGLFSCGFSTVFCHLGDPKATLHPSLGRTKPVLFGRSLPHIRKKLPILERTFQYWEETFQILASILKTRTGTCFGGEAYRVIF